MYNHPTPPHTSLHHTSHPTPPYTSLLLCIYFYQSPTITFFWFTTVENTVSVVIIKLVI